MTDYYVDPAATGSDSGADWTNAWPSLQTALDTVAAGDTVYCRGTEDISAVIDADGTAGTATSRITIIGVNGSGTEDGTRFTLNAANSYAYCLKLNTVHYYTWRNIACADSTEQGLSGQNVSTGQLFVNCAFYSNSKDGAYTYLFTDSLWVRCTAYSNGRNGFHAGGNGTTYLYCSAHDNTENGFHSSNQIGALVGCISYDNTGIGILGSTIGTLLILNCVTNGNGTGGIKAQDPTYVIGCRSTNHSGAGDYGLDANTEMVFEGWNYFEDNDTDIDDSTYVVEIPDDTGTGTSDEDNADTNEGYTSITDGSENFNLRSDASMLEVEIAVPTS